MGDPILDAAEARREELRQELKKIDDFVIMYRSLAGAVKSDESNTKGTLSPPPEKTQGVGNSIADAARETEGPNAAGPRRLRVRDNPKPADVVAATVDVIREFKRPMTRRKIWEALKERGMVVNGTDPVKTLGTILWRSGSDRLTQIDGWGYWPKDLPLPHRPDPAKVTLADLLGDDDLIG